MNDPQTSPFRPHSAMVLAAGLGKRLRPITSTIPKPLVEVRGKALIDYGLEALARAGVEHAVVNVHYLPDLMRAHLRRCKAPRITVSDETDRLLDSGAGVVKALPALGGDPFFLINADTFWVEGYRDNLDVMREIWDPSRMDALLLIADMKRATGYEGRGDFSMDVTGRLRRVPERDMSPFIYAGAAILKPELFAGMSADTPFSLNRVFDAAIESQRLFGVRLDGLWITVGTPGAVREAEETLRASTA